MNWLILNIICIIATIAAFLEFKREKKHKGKAVCILLSTISISILAGFLTYTENNCVKPSIAINELDFYSSQNVNIDKPVFIKQTNTTIPPENKEYVIDWYPEYNVQEVLVTNNNSNNSIVLTNFKLVSQNIQVDYSPRIEANSKGGESKNTVYLYLYNKGWGDATNVNIMLKSHTGELNFSKYDKHLDVLKHAGYITIQFELDLRDFSYLLSNEDIQYYAIDLEVSCDELSDNYIYNTGYNIIVENGEIYVYLGGGGGGNEVIYGIHIDTANSEFEFSQPILEEIKAGEVLQVPIFFYPNKSCEFDYYVEFTVQNGNKQQTIRSDVKHTKYRISSLMDTSIYDASNEAIAHDQYVRIISFPYDKKFK